MEQRQKEGKLRQADGKGWSIIWEDLRSYQIQQEFEFEMHLRGNFMAYAPKKKKKKNKEDCSQTTSITVGPSTLLLTQI